MPANIATAEFAPGQYEINLHHVDDAIAAADHAALLRHIIRSVAQRHGVEASFMPKPFLEQTGNGMHVHVSLLDKQGRNVFADESPLGSKTLKHAIGGLMATMTEAMAIYAPNVNAFRRFGPNLFVPVNRSWGANNRSVAFPIPTGLPTAGASSIASPAPTPTATWSWRRSSPASITGLPTRSIRDRRARATPARRWIPICRSTCRPPSTASRRQRSGQLPRTGVP